MRNLDAILTHLHGAYQTDLQNLLFASPQAGEFNALDDSDNEDDPAGNFVVHVRTALLEVKKGAITAVGEMAGHTGAAFVPVSYTHLTLPTKA